MVKIRAICRDKNDYVRKTNTEIEKVYRNNNQLLHPFRKAREYIRALNAVKLDKVFSKPFLFALNEPTDCIKAMAKNPKSLIEFASGGFDGQLLLYNLAERKPIFNIKTSHNMIKGVVFSNTGEDILTCGDDNVINFYNKPNLYKQKESFELIHHHYHSSFSSPSPSVLPLLPTSSYSSKFFLESIDHSPSSATFATCGKELCVWDFARNAPLQTFAAGEGDGFLRVKYNTVEGHIILATGYDRSISLFDLRMGNPLKAVTLRNKSACCCWNPQEPFNFTVGNEDSNCYTFDMRNLDKIRMIHKDHILAVLDIDYSPTGKEFVTGSFDRTVRIFRNDEGFSREAYHDKRMQKVYSVLYTMDDKYVLSGSDDTNIRVWKSVANDSLGILNKREEDARNYSKKLVEKFKFTPEIKRIKNQKRLPKYIVNKNKERKVKNEKNKRKTQNLERNSKPGTVEYEPERSKKIVKAEIIKK